MGLLFSFLRLAGPAVYFWSIASHRAQERRRAEQAHQDRQRQVSTDPEGQPSRALEVPPVKIPPCALG
jgi:hypothetical protein